MRAFLNTGRGSEIVSYYQETNTLNDIVRRRLIALVVDYFVTNRIKIGTKDCNILADKIVEVFPSEAKSNYFIAGSGKVNAKGGLYIKYNNQIRLYRCKGLIEETPKRSKASEQHQMTNVEQYSDQESSLIEFKSEECDSDDLVS